jgi:hypothetical protein
MCAWTAAVAETFDVAADWSDANNPNGAWAYTEGDNPLPHVDWWERQLGGFPTAQPGWARSEDGNNRIPFWFKSAVTPTFSHDFQIGDVVVHTTDAANGVGNGAGTLTWTSPACGRIDILGVVWPARHIGRSNRWTLLEAGVAVSSGDLLDPGPFSRANPMNLALGTGGSTVLANVPVAVGTVVALRIERLGGFGDFVGVRLTINTRTQPYAAGDLNCDGLVNFGDINPFVLALQDQLGYGQAFPNCNYCNADCNHDGQVNFGDINAFVALLTGG